MAKRCVLIFGAIGYLLTIWFYSSAFAPLTWSPIRQLVSHMCVACPNVTGLHSRVLRGAFLVLGPMNAVIYGAVGFLTARIAQAFKGMRASG
jgi:hypothetical protein